jgi:hypothetical protein
MLCHYFVKAVTDYGYVAPNSIQLHTEFNSSGNSHAASPAGDADTQLTRPPHAPRLLLTLKRCPFGTMVAEKLNRPDDPRPQREHLS